MGKGVKVGVIIIIIALAAGGITWALTDSNTGKKTDNTHHDSTTHSHNSATQYPVENNAEPVAATIAYTANGFDPDTVTVKSGDKVRIVNNNAKGQLEFGSDPHPSHTDNPELNTGDIEHGYSATIIVSKTGKWGFHNHYKPSDHGFITVE